MTATGNSDEKHAKNEACEAAQRDQAEATPDSEGNCQPGRNCSTGGPYDLAVTKARESCDPNQSPKPSKFIYQTQSGTVVYKWNRQRWVRGVPQITRSWINTEPSEKLLPCKILEPPYPEHYQYNRTVHPKDEPARTLPVCTTEKVCLAPPPMPHRYTEQTVTFSQVTHVLSCERTETIRVPVKDEKSPGNAEGNEKSPKQVLPNATLGGEAFQVRAFMVGNPKQREAERLVRLSLWQKAAPANPLEPLRELGGFALAQSEYFYDDEGAAGERGAWMWNMNWRARLVRFASPSDDNAKAGLRKMCGKHIEAAECDRMLRVADLWNDLILH
jgi:hypothetical protein